MKLMYFFVTSLGVFAILHFFWIPSLERRYKVDRSLASIGRSTFLSILGITRGAFLISSLTTLFTIVTMLFLKMLRGVTPEDVGNTIETVREWRSILTGFGSTWGIIITLLLVLALVIHSIRRSKLRMTQAFERIFNDEYERLEKIYDQNELEKLPPTEEMKKIQHELDAIKSILNLEKIGGESNEKRLELEKRTLILKQLLKSLDIQRRIDLRVDPSDVELPKAQTKWEKVQTFFISRGLLKNLNRSSRLVYFLCLLLLIPSLMGIHSPNIVQAVDKRIVDLQDLQFKLKIEQVPTTLNQKKEELGNEDHELSKEDETVIDEATQQFETELYHFHFNNFKGPERFKLRSAVVRDRLLNRTANRLQSVKKHASGSKVKSLTALERQVVQINEKALNTKKKHPLISQTVKKELREVARRSPGFIDKLKIELKNFKTVAKSRDISHSLISHISGNLIDGTGEGEIGRLVQQSVEGIKKRVPMKTLYETKGKRFVLNLVEGKTFEEALNAAKISPEMFETRPVMRTTLKKIPFNDINNKLRFHPPALKTVPELHTKPHSAAKNITKLHQASIASGNYPRVDYSDALAKYRDWFPGKWGAERNTQRWNLQQKLWKTNPIRPKIKLYNSRRAFTRALSFRRLRVFSRVGGVLIGRIPANFSLDIIDIDWKIEGSKIRLILKSSDGKTHTSTNHRMSMVYYALNYAADGRPTTVTMTKALPMMELKILLHPLLVDTPMGYRIIELDRFVDQYTRNDKNRSSAELEVLAQHALYNIAWANRILSLLQFSEEKAQNFPTELQTLKIHVESVIKNNQTRLRATKALLNPDIIGNIERSPLQVKSTFYDSSLVRLTIEKAKSSKSLIQFEEAIRKVSRQKVEFDKSREFLKRWLAPSPEFEIVSGVREKNFKPRLSEIIIPEDTKPPIPFEFMLQIAFTSQPKFGLKENEKQEGFYEDTTPWEFPALKKHIHEIVLKKVRADKQNRIILADTTEFTILQRFFRLAFNGSLGEKFPIEKLLDLEKAIETASPKKKIRTLRWNAIPGIVNMLKKGITEKNRVEINLLLKIRKELGIWKDEQQILNKKNKTLPPLD